MALNCSDYELVVNVNNTVIQDEKGNVLVQNKKGMFFYYRLVFYLGFYNNMIFNYRSVSDVYGLFYSR